MKLHESSPLVIAAATTALIVAAASIGLFASWQWKISDSFEVGHAVPEDVVIVAIDDASIQKVGRWPWARSVHAELIDKLAAAGASAIGYDVNFSEASVESEDQKLERAIAAAGNVVLPFEVTLRFGQTPPAATDVLMPLPRFYKSAPLGFSNMPTDPDGVLRQVPLAVSVEGRGVMPIFSSALLKAAGGKPTVSGSELRIRFVGPAGSFETVSAADVLALKVGPDVFKNKIVLVGATAPDLHDELLTPTAKSTPMSGVETHANVLDGLRLGGLAEEPFYAVVFTILLFALIAAFASMRLKRTLFTVLVFVGVLLAYLLAVFALVEIRIVMDVLYPVAALAVAGAAGTLVRLSKEKREKGQLRATLTRYLSRQVVDYLVKHPEKLVLGGEKREMTVLFSDLRGFTSLSEKLSPEELVAVLNRYLTDMTAIVFEHGGVLDKYMGDAVMAFWNAPLDEPDHAGKAAAAAIRMRERLHEMNRDGSFPPEIELRLGVGVNTGSMVVGNMGGEERFDYTVMGDAVNLGSRLEGLNKEYGTEIIVSETAAAKLSAGVILRPLDLVAVKGKKEPVGIFEVMGAREDLSPETIELASAFSAARDLYRKREFAAARAKFVEIEKRHPEDVPTKVYLSRSDVFIAAPPPTDWDGVWVMTKK